MAPPQDSRATVDHRVTFKSAAMWASLASPSRTRHNRLQPLTASQRLPPLASAAQFVAEYLARDAPRQLVEDRDLAWQFVIREVVAYVLLERVRCGGRRVVQHDESDETLSVLFVVHAQ